MKLDRAVGVDLAGRTPIYWLFACPTFFNFIIAYLLSSNTYV